MYFSETIINAKAVDKLPNCRSIISFRSLQVAATILATCKHYVVPAIARKNIILMQGLIDVLVNFYAGLTVITPYALGERY
jgi:hypothetical protein